MLKLNNVPWQDERLSGVSSLRVSCFESARLQSGIDLHADGTTLQQAFLASFVLVLKFNVSAAELALQQVRLGY